MHCAGNAPEGNHKSDGPVGLVLAPTRELAVQIHQVAAALGKAVGLRVASVFGGVEKTEQFRQLKAGAAVAVATPCALGEVGCRPTEAPREPWWDNFFWRPSRAGGA